MGRLKLTLLLLSLFVAQSGFAASSVWKVEKSGKVLYLGGTFHLLTAEDFPLPIEYDKAFNASQKLVLEADIRLTDDPMFVAEMQSRMRYRDGRTLSSVLSPEVFRKLDDYLRERQLSADFFNTVTAGSMSMTLTVMEMHDLGFTEEGVDGVFYNKARQSNTPISFFETPQQQIEFVASMGEGIEDELITSTLKDMSSLTIYMDQMAMDWRKGDVLSLERTALQDMREYPAVYETLLVSRNKKWLAEIIQLLETDEVESVFVGVLHLIGEDGLLEQLRHRGYTITQL